MQEQKQPTINKAVELSKIVSSLSDKPTKTATFKSLLDSMKSQIANALPSHLTPERMMRIAMTAYNSNPKLQECDPMTIIAGVMQASQLGLEVNTTLGQAYLIPYNNKNTGKTEAQFQTGYKGELNLAYRTGQYKIITAYCAYEEDKFEYQYGSDPFVKHKPAKERTGEPIYYYAVYKTISGGEGFLVMSRNDVEKHARKYSQAYKKGFNCPWKTDFDAMAMKTCLKQLLNYAPKSIEYERAFSQDGTIKKEISKDMATVPDQFDWDSLESANNEQNNG
ncbi:MAG: recombinase RecT [Candidatus Neomarinimicrobiota bacterium]